MSDNKKLDLIIEQLNAVDKKINEQNKRLSLVENVLFPNRPKPAEPAKIEPQEKQSATHKAETIKPKKKIESESRNLELDIGKYLFQIVGAGIFVIGMGFLFQYSIEQGLISPLVRVIAGFIAATALVVGGEFSKKRQWTLGLIAGGISLYYITLFAATIMYGLLSLMPAFLASTAITTLAFILGFRHNSVLIAFFSLVGGFLSPMFAHSLFLDFRFFDPEHTFFIITYLIVLATAFTALSLVKQWVGIAAGTLFFMLSYTYTPMIQGLTLNQQLSYLTLFYVIFTLLPYAYTYIVTIKDRFIEPCMIAAGSILSFSSYQSYLVSAVLNEKMGESFAPVQWLFAEATQKQTTKYLLFIFGFLFLIKAVALFYQKTVSQSMLATISFGAIAAFFGVILLQFKGFTLGMAIQSYALLILSMSFFLKEFYLRVLSFLLLGFGFIVYLLNIKFGLMPTYQSVIFNDLNLATIVLILIFATAAYLAHKNKKQLTGDQKDLPQFLEICGYSIPLIWMLSPLWHYPYYISAIAFYSLIVFLIGVLDAKEYLRKLSYTSLTMAIIGFVYKQSFFLLMYFLLQPIHVKDYYDFNVLCATFIIILSLYTLTAKIAKKELSKVESSDLIQKSELLLSIFTFFCIGKNLYLYTEDAWFHLTAMSVYYGISGLILIFIGLVFNKKHIRYFGLFASGLTLWTLWFIIIGMKNTLNRVIIFISVGLIFMLASLIYQKLSKETS